MPLDAPVTIATRSLKAIIAATLQGLGHQFLVHHLDAGFGGQLGQIDAMFAGHSPGSRRRPDSYPLSPSGTGWPARLLLRELGNDALVFLRHVGQGFPRLADQCHDVAHGQDAAFPGHDPAQDAGSGRFGFDHTLVGGDFGDHFALGNCVALLLAPPRQGGVLDVRARLGKSEFGCHVPRCILRCGVRWPVA
jgi:hypothetical protein